MILSLFVLINFISGIFFIKLFKKIAIKYNIIDNPSSNIKLHTKPTPYLGGVAFILNSILVYLVYRFVTDGLTSVETTELIVLLLSLVIMLMGVIDDIKKIRPSEKIIIQSIVILILLFFDIRLKIIYFPPVINYILTYIWILGITNAFNLIDVMDGLCGGTAAIAAFFLFFTSQSSTVFLIFLSISLVAFLIYNFPPAKIFMGDAGSLTIGFVLSVYSVIGSYGHNNRLALISPILILWLPIYETILVSLLRIKKGKSPFMGSKDHFAFRLKALGFPTLAILLISYFLNIIMGETAFLAAYMDLNSAVFVYFLLILFFVITFHLLSLINVDKKL